MNHRRPHLQTLFSTLLGTPVEYCRFSEMRKKAIECDDLASSRDYMTLLDMNKANAISTLLSVSRKTLSNLVCNALEDGGKKYPYTVTKNFEKTLRQF